jgi:ketosteroid isomerase-like protein
MSKENLELVRRSFEAWNRRDLTSWWAFVHPGVEVDWSRSRAPFKGVYRGRDRIEAFWEVFWLRLRMSKSRRTASPRWAPR